MDIINYLKTGTISTVLIILGVLGLFFLPGILTSYAAILGNIGFGILIFYIIDRYVLKTVDIIEEIKKGNIAFGLMLLAFALIIAASISAS